MAALLRLLPLPAAADVRRPKNLSSSVVVRAITAPPMSHCTTLNTLCSTPNKQDVQTPTQLETQSPPPLSIPPTTAAAAPSTGVSPLSWCGPACICAGASAPPACCCCPTQLALPPAARLASCCCSPARTKAHKQAHRQDQARVMVGYGGRRKAVSHDITVLCWAKWLVHADRRDKATAPPQPTHRISIPCVIAAAICCSQSAPAYHPSCSNPPPPHTHALPAIPCSTYVSTHLHFALRPLPLQSAAHRMHPSAQSKPHTTHCHFWDPPTPPPLPPIHTPQTTSTRNGVSPPPPPPRTTYIPALPSNPLFTPL